MKSTFKIDDRRHFYNLLQGRWFYLSRQGVRGPFLTEQLALQDLADLKRDGERRKVRYVH